MIKFEEVDPFVKIRNLLINLSLPDLQHAIISSPLVQLIAHVLHRLCMLEQIGSNTFNKQNKLIGKPTLRCAAAGKTGYFRSSE